MIEDSDRRRIYGLVDDLILTFGSEQLALSFLARQVYEHRLLDAVYEAMPEGKEEDDS